MAYATCYNSYPSLVAQQCRGSFSVLRTTKIAQINKIVALKSINYFLKETRLTCNFTSNNAIFPAIGEKFKYKCNV